MQRIRPWAGSTPFLRRRSLPNAVCFLARVTAGTCRNERDPRRESARCQAVIPVRTRLRVRARLTSGNITTIVLAGIGGQSTPSTTDIQQSVRGLEVELFAHERELVVLQLFQGLKLGRVRDDSRGVNPTRYAAMKRGVRNTWFSFTRVISENHERAIMSVPKSLARRRRQRRGWRRLTCVGPRTTRRNRHRGHSDP